MKLFLTMLVAMLSLLGCSKPTEALARRPGAAEVSGIWHSDHKISGSRGATMQFELSVGKTCSFTSIPIYDQTVREYRVFTGTGKWMIIPHTFSGNRSGFQLVLMPDGTDLTASLDILLSGESIVFRYSTDPELSESAIFRKR